MTRTIVTHNDFHAGDNLIFLHLLRSLAKANPATRFVHFGIDSILEQCASAVEDISNIELFSFDSEQWEELRPKSINTWKNAGATDTRKGEVANYQQGHWERSKHRWNWSAHALEHHAWTADRMGVRSPFSHVEHLLFDYPALNPNQIGGSYFYDFLIINSEPCSGQFKPMAEHGSGYLNDLALRLSKRFAVITTAPVHGIECTRDNRQSLTDIGRLSLLCRHHIMIATGPMWPTFNTTNHHFSAGRKRIAILDNGERLNMPNITQVASREAVQQIAHQEGWL